MKKEYFICETQRMFITYKMCAYTFTGHECEHIVNVIYIYTLHADMHFIMIFDHIIHLHIHHADLWLFDFKGGDIKIIYIIHLNCLSGKLKNFCFINLILRNKRKI